MWRHAPRAYVIGQNCHKFLHCHMVIFKLEQIEKQIKNVPTCTLKIQELIRSTHFWMIKVQHTQLETHFWMTKVRHTQLETLIT